MLTFEIDKDQSGQTITAVIDGDLVHTLRFDGRTGDMQIIDLGPRAEILLEDGKLTVFRNVCKAMCNGFSSDDLHAFSKKYFLALRLARPDIPFDSLQWVDAWA